LHFNTALGFYNSKASIWEVCVRKPPDIPLV